MPVVDTGPALCATGASEPPAAAPIGPAGVVAEELTGISLPVTGSGARTAVPGAWRGQLLAYALTVFALVTLTFFLPRAMPGDPLAAMFDSASPSALADGEMRQKQLAYYGLDRPLVVQYGRYLRDLARGEMGMSIRYGMPVRELVVDRAPWTLLLLVSALALALAVGVPAGVHAGWNRGRRIDRGLLALFVAFRGFPVFFLASLASFVLAARLGWFPLGGESTPFSDLGVGRTVLDVAYHLVLPMTVLATQFSAGYYLLMRAGMVGELGADYLLMGRAKGLREHLLKYRYAARNALLPVLTLTAVHFGHAVTAAIFVERVFAYKGMGLLMVEAVDSRDYPTLQACFLVLSLMVVTANFATDLIYRRVDPRSVA